MNRQEFYKDLGNCAEKLGIEWKLSGDTIRGHGGNYFNEHGFEEYLCPLTAVAELHGKHREDGKTFCTWELESAAKALNLTCSEMIATAADTNSTYTIENYDKLDKWDKDYMEIKSLAYYQRAQKLREKLLEVTGLKENSK